MCAGISDSTIRFIDPCILVFLGWLRSCLYGKFVVHRDGPDGKRCSLIVSDGGKRGLVGGWCPAGSCSWEGRPLYVGANGPPVQAPGPPTTCRQNTLRGALGSGLWRKRLVPIRQFAQLSCLPTPVLFEARNKAVRFAPLA